MAMVTIKHPKEPGMVSFSDYTKELGLEVGSEVTDSAGRTWLYLGASRRPGAVTGGVYQCFIQKDHIAGSSTFMYQAVELDTIRKRFPPLSNGETQ